MYIYNVGLPSEKVIKRMSGSDVKDLNRPDLGIRGYEQTFFETESHHLLRFCTDYAVQIPVERHTWNGRKLRREFQIPKGAVFRKPTVRNGIMVFSWDLFGDELVKKCDIEEAQSRFLLTRTETAYIMKEKEVAHWSNATRLCDELHKNYFIPIEKGGYYPLTYVQLEYINRDLWKKRKLPLFQGSEKRSQLMYVEKY